MDFTLSYNNKEEVLVFPVVPNGGIQLSRDQDNQAFDGINHELQALGNMKLATFSITSFFPLKRYSFLRPYSSINGWHYVRVIEAVRKRKIPFRALHLDNNGQEVFNLPVTVENFEYWLDQAGDIGYTIDFKEYRFANGSAATLSKPKDAAGEKTQTAAQFNASTGSSSGGAFTKRYTATDAKMIAKVMWGEARGIKSKTEVACIGWCILNRVDAGMGKTLKPSSRRQISFFTSRRFPPPVRLVDTTLWPWPPTYWTVGAGKKPGSPTWAGCCPNNTSGMPGTDHTTGFTQAGPANGHSAGILRA